MLPNLYVQTLIRLFGMYAGSRTALLLPPHSAAATSTHTHTHSFVLQPMRNSTVAQHQPTDVCAWEIVIIIEGSGSSRRAAHELNLQKFSVSFSERINH